MSPPSAAGTRTATAPGRPRMDPRIGRRRAEVTRAKGRRRLRVVLAGLLVVALAAGALAVLHSPLLSARHVSVVGTAHTTRAAVLRAAGIHGHPPLIDVDPGAASARVEALPWVGTATVSRRWPDSVVVRVTERVAVAAVAAGTASYLVDGTGRILGPAPSTGLPLLRSPARPGRPGSILGPRAHPGLVVAAALARILPGRVQDVVVGSDASVTVDLGGGVRAVLGPASAVDAKLAALASVLTGAAPSGAETIDVSIPGEPTVAPAASAPA